MLTNNLVLNCRLERGKVKVLLKPTNYCITHWRLNELIIQFRGFPRLCQIVFNCMYIVHLLWCSHVSFALLWCARFFCAPKNVVKSFNNMSESVWPFERYSYLSENKTVRNCQRLEYLQYSTMLGSISKAVNVLNDLIEFVLFSRRCIFETLRLR